MGRLGFFGYIREKHAKQWKGTKIHVNKGKFPPKAVYLPGYIANYFNEKADGLAEAFSSMYQKQRKVVEAAIVKNADKLLNPKYLELCNIMYFVRGENAFTITEEMGGEEE